MTGPDRLGENATCWINKYMLDWNHLKSSNLLIFYLIAAATFYNSRMENLKIIRKTIFIEKMIT